MLKQVSNTYFQKIRGLIFDAFLYRFGSPFGGRFGVVLGAVWESIWEPFSIRFGNSSGDVLVRFAKCLGVVFESIWTPFGLVCAPFGGLWFPLRPSSAVFGRPVTCHFDEASK